jgi:hypothetical protein
MFIYIIIFFLCFCFINESNVDNLKNINKKLEQVYNNQLRICEKFDNYSDFVSQKIEDIYFEKINKTSINLDQKIEKIERMKNTIDSMKKRIIDLENKKNDDSFEIKLNESKKYNFII